MVTAVKTASQLATHMGIAFAIMYGLTGSVAFGGASAMIEPVCNVALLPLHQRLWAYWQARAGNQRRYYALLALEKLSQTGLHMIVAFIVMYGLTGSLAFGGIAALMEPVANVLILPVHDRLWQRLAARLRRPDLAGADRLHAA